MSDAYKRRGAAGGCLSAEQRDLICLFPRDIISSPPPSPRYIWLAHTRHKTFMISRKRCHPILLGSDPIRWMDRYSKQDTNLLYMN